MKMIHINPNKSQTKTVKETANDIKLAIWEAWNNHPVTFVEPKEVVIEGCRLKCIGLTNGKYAYCLGLPIFGTFHYSPWYTV